MDRPLICTRTRFYVLATAMSLIFSAACGEDTGSDDLPNLITGLSGLVLLGVIIWLVARAIRRRGRRG